ncbi:MAG: amino acid ABC transporter substrate-binding protein [Sutterella wadsworthensis]|nr:amino acid ABC transporter substrate-binding protein [Sutterella wadsworthensis]
MKKRLLSMAALLAASAVATPALAGVTLDAVKKRGHVLCGVNTSAPGFSSADSQGNWHGLDVNICRSVAAAVLGDADKVKFVPLSSPQRFTALQAGEIDILARNTTWTMTRDASQGSVFVAVSYYDGQGFIVPKEYGIKSAKELDGATICVQSGTSSEKTLADYFNSHKMSYKTVVFDTTEATQSAFLSGRCQVYTTDMSDLAGMRTLAPNPQQYEILSEVISKEPLGPAVRRGDDEWFQVVRWSFNTMIEAEELGINKANAEQLKQTSTNPNVLRLLGRSDDMGKMIGLDKDWSYRIVTQVGNYGESWNAYFGPKSPLNLPRGLNRLWTDGGLMYAMPIR